QVSAMINLMRNLGGSIGISAVTTLIARRQQVHQYYLSRNTFEYNPFLQNLLTNMTNHFAQRSSEADAQMQAFRGIYQTVQQQASVLAYIDTFRITGVVCLLAIILLFFAKKTKGGESAAAH